MADCPMCGRPVPQTKDEREAASRDRAARRRAATYERLTPLMSSIYLCILEQGSGTVGEIAKRIRREPQAVRQALGALYVRRKVRRFQGDNRQTCWANA